MVEGDLVSGGPVEVEFKRALILSLATGMGRRCTVQEDAHETHPREVYAQRNHARLGVVDVDVEESGDRLRRGVVTHRLYTIERREAQQKRAHTGISGVVSMVARHVGCAHPTTYLVLQHLVAVQPLRQVHGDAVTPGFTMTSRASVAAKDCVGRPKGRLRAAPIEDVVALVRAHDGHAANGYPDAISQSLLKHRDLCSWM